MSGSNRLGIKGTIASLIAAGTLCSGAFAQFDACLKPPKGAGDCTVETPGIPGCTSEECCNTVCAIDANCCVIEWDELCVTFALIECSKFQCESCGQPSCGDCFVDNGTPHCADTCSGKDCPGCCLTICAFDPYCCALPPFEDVGNWDNFCMDEALEFCSCELDQIPINDDCEDATEIAEGVHNFTTECASLDGYVSEDPSCWDGFTMMVADVWFHYIATVTGAVRVHTCGVQADFDSKLAVYDGYVCPIPEESLIECNDNACGDGSEVIFEVVEGNSYTIRLGGGYLSPSGIGTFTIEPLGAPSNDDCASAVPISLNESVPFNNFVATLDGSPSLVCDIGGESDIDLDVWFSFTSPVTATMQVNLCASTFDTKAAVYAAGVCPPVVDPIACDDDGCGTQSLVGFDAVKGQTYLIRAGSKPGTGGGAGTIAVTQFTICDVGTVVLLDQIGPDFSALTGNQYASQDFDPANDDSDIAALDDFIVPDGPDVTLTCVDTAAAGFNGFDSAANITNYALHIYSSPEAAGMDLTGDVASLASVPVVLVDPFDADNGTFLFHMDLTGIPGPAITLSPGTYWIAVVPEMDFAAGFGQSAIRGSTIDGSGNGPNGHQANPNGFFGFPNGFQQIDPAANLAYRLVGDPAKGGGETVFPSDYTIFRGLLNSGTLADVEGSDNVDLCHDEFITIFPAEAPVTLDFDGTLANDSPATLEVTFESSANTPSLEITISFFNYNTASWDIVGTTGHAFLNDAVHTFAGTPADHVEAGTGNVRTRYEVRKIGPVITFPFTDCIDELFWTTTD